jgi:hypothetical protein
LTTVCTGCQQAWQHGGGRDLPISETDREIAECDAQRVGSDREPGTAAQDVAPKVRRFVTLRDRKHCVVPGCRASRHIDVHHIVPRHLGGGHEAENLTLLCSGHHRALHDGSLTITGRAPELVVTWKYPVGVGAITSGQPHVGQPRIPPETETGPAQAPSIAPPPVSSYGRVVTKTEAATALAQLGYTKQQARALVDEAASKLPHDASLERLVAEALRCARRELRVEVLAPDVHR